MLQGALLTYKYTENLVLVEVPKITSTYCVDSPRLHCAGRPSLPQAGKRAKVNNLKETLFPPKEKRGWTSNAMSG